MSQMIAMILRVRESQSGQFEEMFQAEVMPLWEEFSAQGKFAEASLTSVEGGGEELEGISVSTSCTSRCPG